MIEQPPLWEQWSWKATVIGAFATVMVALWQGFVKLSQQKKELRWKQAELARQLVDRWFDWKASNNALTMVDEGAASYSLDGFGSHTVDPMVDIPHALAISHGIGGPQVSNDSPKDRFIQKCFDVLFFQLDRAERSIELKLVHRSDLLTPTRYYVRQIARYKSAIEPYAVFTGFQRAIAFLRYFPEWSGLEEVQSDKSFWKSGSLSRP